MLISVVKGKLDSLNRWKGNIFYLLEIYLTHAFLINRKDNGVTVFIIKKVKNN